MILLEEVTDRERLGKIYDRLDMKIPYVFYQEDMTREEFCALFSGSTRLYEVFDGNRSLGVVWLFAENRYAVKIGLMSYNGGKYSQIREGMNHICRKLASRGITALVADVRADNKIMRSIMGRLGWTCCGTIKRYFGDESLMIYSIDPGEMARLQDCKIARLRDCEMGNAGCRTSRTSRTGAGGGAMSEAATH